MGKNHASQYANFGSLLINASDSPKGFKYKYKAAINASSS